MGGNATKEFSIIKVSDKEVLYGLENENREIDFNVIIPSPKIFDEFDYSFCDFSSRIGKLDKETLTPLVEKFIDDKLCLFVIY